MASNKKEDCKNGVSCKYYSAGKCTFKHPPMQKVAPMKGKTKEYVKEFKPKMSHDTIRFMAKAVQRRKLALDSAKGSPLVRTEPPKGYVLVPDSKSVLPTSESVTALQELFDSELKMARGAIQAAYGTRPVSFRCPTSDTDIKGVATVTTGVVATVTNVDVTVCSEFTALASLFDEYRIRRGEYHYFIGTPTAAVTIATAQQMTTASMFGIGFDPADAVALGFIGAVMQLAQHQILAPRVQEANTGGGAVYTGCYGKQNNAPFVFRWHYNDIAEITGSGGVVAPGMWKATQGNVNTFIEGSLKMYFVSGTTVAVTVVFGVGVYEMEFRSRT